jgi:CHAD domain-containing protein
MRVAMRRMRAAFRLFKTYYEKQTAKRLRQGLKQTGRALGGVRDLDVLRIQVNAYRETLPKDRRKELEGLLSGINEQREQARAMMFATLGSFEHRQWLEAMQTFVENEGMAIRQSPSTRGPAACCVEEVVPELIYRHFKQVRAYGATLAQADIPHLHALRIEVKRFRYTLEFFQRVLGPEAAEVIARAVALQDHLGDLHDMDVARIFAQGVMDNSKAQRVGLKAYLEYLNSTIQANLSEVPAAWETFVQADTRKKLAAAVGNL